MGVDVGRNGECVKGLMMLEELVNDLKGGKCGHAEMKLPGPGWSRSRCRARLEPGNRLQAVSAHQADASCSGHRVRGGGLVLFPRSPCWPELQLSPCGLPCRCTVSSEVKAVYAEADPNQGPHGKKEKMRTTGGGCVVCPEQQLPVLSPLCSALDPQPARKGHVAEDLQDKEGARTGSLAASSPMS